MLCHEQSRILSLLLLLLYLPTGLNPQTNATGRALLLQLLQQHTDNCSKLQQQQQQQQQQEEPAEDWLPADAAASAAAASSVAAAPSVAAASFPILLLLLRLLLPRASRCPNPPLHPQKGLQHLLEQQQQQCRQLLLLQQHQLLVQQLVLLLCSISFPPTLSLPLCPCLSVSLRPLAGRSSTYMEIELPAVWDFNSSTVAASPAGFDEDFSVWHASAITLWILGRGSHSRLPSRWFP